MPATQSSATRESEQPGKPFIYVGVALFIVLACGISIRIFSRRRDRRRRIARDAAAQSQPSSWDEKRPGCHEIWLSPPSGSSQCTWQGILPVSAETILPSLPPPGRDKSPSRHGWSLMKDIHRNRHPTLHPDSLNPSTISLQPSISQDFRPYENPVGYHSQMNDNNAGLLQVAVLLAMPHAPRSGSTTRASMCPVAERLPHGDAVPDVCVGVAHIPFKSEESGTRTDSPSPIIPILRPSAVRVRQSLLPSVATVRLGHPLTV